MMSWLLAPVYIGEEMVHVLSAVVLFSDWLSEDMAMSWVRALLAADVDTWDSDLILLGHYFFLENAGCTSLY